MANPKVLVDNVSSLSSSPHEVQTAKKRTPPTRHLTVSFQGGQSGLLDMTVPRSVAWAEVLHSMRESNLPAYVEIDPATNMITELLQPLTAQVGELKETAFGVDVELIISHARHSLERTNPRYSELLKALQTAKKNGGTVLVTETLDRHQIIDVRPAAKARAAARR